MNHTPASLKFRTTTVGELEQGMKFFAIDSEGKPCGLYVVADDRCISTAGKRALCIATGQKVYLGADTVVIQAGKDEGSDMSITYYPRTELAPASKPDVPVDQRAYLWTIGSSHTTVDHAQAGRLLNGAYYPPAAVAVGEVVHLGTNVGGTLKRTK